MYKPEQYTTIYGESHSRGFFETTTKTWDIEIKDWRLFYGYCAPSHCFGIPYKIDSEFPDGLRRQMHIAMEEIESESGLR